VDWAAAAKLAFGASLAVLVFGSGLGARFSGVAALLRRPGLLARSLLAVLVIAPALAVARVLREATLFNAADQTVLNWVH